MLRKEHDRASKAIKEESVEPESEALMIKEHDRAKRALEPESETLLRKEHDRASKAKKRVVESLNLKGVRCAYVLCRCVLHTYYVILSLY